MKYFVLIQLIFFVFLNNLFAQNIKQQYDSITGLQIENHKKETLLKTLLLKTTKEKSNKLLFNFYHYVAETEYNKKNFKKALFYVDKEHLLVNEIASLSSKEKDKHAHLYGNILYVNNRLKEATSFIKQYFIKNNTRILDSKIFSLMGFLYLNSGEYSKAIDFYQKAIFESVKVGDKNLIVRNKYKLSKIYFKIGDSLNCIRGINTLTEVLKLIDEYGIHNYNFKVNRLLGGFYRNKYINDRKNAYMYYERSLIYAKDDNDKLYSVYNNLGTLYNTNKSDSAELKKALFYLLKAKKYASKEKSLHLSNNIAINYYWNQDYYKAYEAYSKSLEFLFRRKNIKEIQPTFDEFINIKDKRNLLIVLGNLSYTLIELFKQNGNQKYLHEALQILSKYEYLINFHLQEAIEENSKQYWNKRASEFYLVAVEVCFHLNKPKEVFYYMEKNKAILLLNNSNIRQLKLSLKISDTLLQKENQLKKDILLAEVRIKEAKDSELSNFQNSLFEKKIQLDYFKDSLSNNYPNYYKINRKLRILSFEKVKSKYIKDDTIIISYMWSKVSTDFDALYCLVISKNNSEIFKIEGLENFEYNTNQFRKLVSKPFISEHDIAIYKEMAFKLYQKLFPTNELQKFIRGKKLIIIPDGDLQYIPFEALITNKDTNKYLIETSEIWYEYSLSFLEQNNKLQRNPKQDFIGFAPIRFNNDSLSTLYNSKKELNQIKKILTSKSYFKKNATKEKFLAEMDKAKIIHLATHAESNDKLSPWIAFKNSKLYLDELYLTQNQAELVVLSACNTSKGELVAGEGVLSLARGFFYSGTNSVVSSLWNTDDKSTVYITQNFYKSLKEGKTKSAALRGAKLKYLQSHSLSEKSPYYWSTLILIGDNSPIEFSSDYKLFVYTLSALLFLSLLFFIRKRFLKE